MTKKKIQGFNHPLEMMLMSQLCQCRKCGSRWHEEYMGYAVMNGARMYDWCSECSQPSGESTLKTTQDRYGRAQEFLSATEGRKAELIQEETDARNGKYIPGRDCPVCGAKEPTSQNPCPCLYSDGGGENG